MKKNFSFKIKELNKIHSKREFEEVINLIKIETTHSILSKLSTSVIKDYLKIAINSKNILLFVLKNNTKIIGFSLYAKNNKNLIEDFKSIKFKILINLILNFRFFSIFNILLAISKLDLIMINKKKTSDIEKSLNLNLLAIDKKFQSQGIGNIFFEKTNNIIYKNFFVFESIVCEAPTQRALNFYIKKNNFRYIGKKIRLGQNLFVLKKKYK
tara:strand:- start:2900 stop:3535 length:636 start_codon:yes stop_codon:yes gene_type:complete